MIKLHNVYLGCELEYLIIICLYRKQTLGTINHICRHPKSLLQTWNCSITSTACKAFVFGVLWSEYCRIRSKIGELRGKFWPNTEKMNQKKNTDTITLFKIAHNKFALRKSVLRKQSIMKKSRVSGKTVIASH